MLIQRTMKKIFTLLFVLFLTGTTTIGQVPTDGLVGSWLFSGNTNDDSGNGNNGIASGGGYETDRFGLQSAAFSDGGTVSIPSSSSLNLTTKLTVAAWVLPSLNYYGTYSIIEKQSSYGSLYGFSVSVDPNYQGSYAHPHCFTTNPTNGCIEELYPYPQGYSNWVFIAYTFDLSAQYPNYVCYSDGNFTNHSCTQPCGTSNDPLVFHLTCWDNKIDDIRIYNRALSHDEITAIYNEDPHVIITGQPQNESVCIGSSATFTVSATGRDPISYQWYKNNNLMPGDTSFTLTIINAQQSDAASYHCVVSNPYGTVTSNSATLTFYVVPPPTIYGPTEVGLGSIQTYYVNPANGSSYLFTVGNGIKISNNATSITVQWNNMGTGYITCNETDEFGCSSNNQILYVHIGTTGMDESLVQVEIWPNPTSGFIKISSDRLIKSISVFSSIGLPISKEKYNDKLVILDLSSYPKGVYYLQISSGKGLITKKVVML